MCPWTCFVGIGFYIFTMKRLSFFFFEKPFIKQRSITFCKRTYKSSNTNQNKTYPSAAILLSPGEVLFVSSKNLVQAFKIMWGIKGNKPSVCVYVCVHSCLFGCICLCENQRLNFRCFPKSLSIIFFKHLFYLLFTLLQKNLGGR